MLPVRLTLRNFLPYRAPDPIRFEGLHLACLSGPNGAGKSSLLDAITWALWGRARGKSDQDLITLGAEEMSVELDFEQAGALYRVTRQRMRKRRQGSLNLFIWDEHTTGGFKEISAATMRATQERINLLLRLDYDTFVHSAFLQQGKADAFTTKTPAERKKILGDILGLEAWRIYEERARLRLREIETALGNIDGRLAQIEDDLARQPALERDLAEAEAVFAEAESALQAAEARYDAIKDAPVQLRATTDRLADLTRRLQEYESDETALLAELDRLGQRIAAYEAIIAQREAIEEGFATLEAARQADQTLSDKLLDLQDAERRRHTLESQIAAARAALEARASDHRGAIEELERLAHADDITAQLEAVEARIAALEEREAERESVRAAISRLQAEAAGLQSTNERLLEEMHAIKARLDTLAAADPAAAICPTCRQPLAPAQRQQLIDDYRTEGTTRGDQYRANTARLQAIEAEIKDLERASAALLDAIAPLAGLRQQAGELHARQAAARDADNRLTEERAALEAVQAALAAENYAGEARAQLAALQEEIATLGYDRSAHAAARENLSVYQAYERRQQELHLALEQLPDVQKAAEAAHARLERLRRVREEDAAALAEITAEVERLKTLVAEANRRFDEARELRAAWQQAGERRARAQQALHALEAARQRRAALKDRRAALVDEQAVFEQLRDAFGKNGIPAMIIEAAIPELEDETNALLARMTDGQMQVQFNTQREKVSGGISETLDITITDAAGTRDYALYSGGEAFRINFAIRVALSKLLARRAGAQLRTLFIDEGFGTQDEMGRERLVEAINAIAGDFDLILVITHLDDLRDAFPARLEVEKTASGSRVRIA
ncbi:MAG: SMC family ATPase [Anaerolineae bacterium]